MAQQQFEGLLTNMMSAVNDIRQQGEATFDVMKQQQPSQVVQALLQVGRTSANHNLRSFSLILLRRALVTLPEKSLWNTIDPQTKELVKRELLNGLETEENSSVRSGLCDASTELASEIFDAKGEWVELLEWLLRMANSTAHTHRESALTIFSQLAPYLAKPFLDKFQVLKNVLVSGLQDRESQKVRLAALEAMSNFIQVFSDSKHRKELQQLTPLMLDILASTLNQQDEEAAQNVLKVFIDIAELDSGFFKPSLNVVFDAMVKIVQVADLDESIRQLAMEFLVTYAENKPNLCRQAPGLVQNLIGLTLQMMLEIEEEEDEWTKTEDADDGTSNAIVAQEDLDRICMALGGEVVVPIVFNHIPNFLSNRENWKFRFVGLMALSMVAEGCHDYLLPNLEQIVQMMVPYFDDPNARVRWAAANAGGQLSTDFGPTLQSKFHPQLLPCLIKLMDDSNPKVKSHSTSAIINFCEKFHPNLIVPYLDGLLGKLHTLMKSGVRSVQEQAVTAVASVACCAGKLFAPYYANFMPLLIEAVSAPLANKDYRSLKGKLIECISLIGVSVGKELFMKDAVGFMEILAKLQATVIDADDPQREYIFQSWTRISTCLGQDFVPYLEYVMPPLLKSAEARTSVQIINPNTNVEEEQGWEYIEVGDKKIALHTAALDEKATSCNLIYCYASEMKEGFFPFVEKSSNVLIPLLDFNYHDGVRMAALSAMPALLESAKLYLEKNNQPLTFVSQLFHYIYPKLVSAVSEENDQEVLVVGIEAIHESISVMGKNCLTPEQVKDLVNFIKSTVVATQERRKELSGRNHDEDLDDSYVVRDELLKEDDITVELAEIVGALVMNHPESFLAAFNDLAPIILQLVQKTSAPSERQLALCVFDDMVEHTREHSYPLFQHFVPFMLEYASDPHPGVRQAALYGLGVCVQHGGDNFKPIVPKVLEILVNVINGKDSRVDKNAPPTENAISSVGKIIRYCSPLLGDQLPQVVDMWVNWLPINIDNIEAKVVHDQLFDFIKTNNNLVFGANYKNLPKVLSVFAQILGTDLISTEGTNSIKEILNHMKQSFPADLLQSAFGSITAAEQQKISEFTK